MRRLRAGSLILSMAMLLQATAPAVAAGLQYRVPLKLPLTSGQGSGSGSGGMPGAPGTVTPDPNAPAGAFALAPGALELNTTVGRAVTALATVENHGTATATLGTLSLSPAVDGLSITDTCSGKSMAPAAACGVAVTYDGLKAGQFNASLSVSGSAIPVTVNASSDTSTARVFSVGSDMPRILPNSAFNNTLSATVHDVYGNLAPAGVPITWATSYGTLLSATSMTNAEGVATNRLKASAPGSAEVSATGPAGVAKATTVTVGGDPATARVNTISGTPTTGIFADNTAYSTITAVVRDESTFKVGAGVPVAWTTNKGTLSAATTYTDANGEASVRLTSASVGTASVFGTSVAGAAKYVNVSFVANAASARIVSITPYVSTLPADGTTLTTLVVKVLDGSGNVLPTQIVQFASTMGTLNKTSGGTDTSGNTTVTLKSGTSGTAEFTATLSASGVFMTIPIEFIPPPAGTYVSSVTVTGGPLQADGTSKAVLVATVLDAIGNPYTYPGAKVSWNIMSGKGTITATTYTDSTGTATSTFTAGTASGTVQIRALGLAGSGITTPIDVTANMATAYVYQVLSNASPKANGTATSTITAVVRDGSNNNVEGATVYLSTTLGTLAQSAVVTDSTGRATTTITSTEVGTARVTGTLGRGDAGTYANVSFIKP